MFYYEVLVIFIVKSAIEIKIIIFIINYQNVVVKKNSTNKLFWSYIKPFTVI